MENSSFEKFYPKWVSGQKLLTFLLVGILICMSSAFISLIEKNEKAVRHEMQLTSRNVMLQTKNVELEKANAEVKRLLFKEEYYAKKNPTLSECLDAAWKYGQKYPKITPALIMNVQYVETRNNPFAISPAGAVGIMQVMYPVWHEELKIDISRMQEIDYGTYLGVEVLHIYEQEENGNMIEALRKYNAGARKHLAGTYALDTLGGESTQLKLVKMSNQNAQIKPL